MKNKLFIFIIIIGIFIILVSPALINKLIIMDNIFKENEVNKGIGFIISFYGAIFGGIIAGLFTFLGVKITIKQQHKKEDEEKNNHQKMLYSQLNFTYNLFYKNNGGEIKNRDEIKKKIGKGFIIYDSDWTKHLIFVDNLTNKEFRFIVNWFVELKNLEIIIQNQTGLTHSALKKHLMEQFPNIETLMKNINKKLEH